MVMFLLTAMLWMSHVISERVTTHTKFELDDLVKRWPEVSQPHDTLDDVSVEVWKAVNDKLNIQNVIVWIEDVLPQTKEAPEALRLRCINNFNKVESSLINSSNQLSSVHVAIARLNVLTYFFGAPPGLDNMNIRSWLQRIDWEILTATTVKNVCANHNACGRGNDAEGVAADVESWLGRAIGDCVEEVSEAPDMDGSSLAKRLIQIYKDGGVDINY